MKILTKPGLLFILIGCLGIGFIVFKYLKKKYDHQNSNPITTTKPIYKDLVQFVNSSGNLKAKDQITIGSLVAGKIEKLLADDNDMVKKGQVLAILDDGVGDSNVKKAQADLIEAKANLEYQEKFYQRQKSLYKSGQLSQNAFDQYTQAYKVAKVRVEQTKALLELAEKTYANLFIKSPDDGIVIARKVDLGQMVTALLQASVLFELAKDLTDMEAWIDVDEADIGMIKEGQDALISVDAFPKLRFNAKVLRIQYLAKNVDNVITYATVLSVKNPDLKLRPGMTTNVDIKVSESAHALSIPNKAFRINVQNLEAACELTNKKLIKANDESLAPKTDAEKKAAGKISQTHKEYVWIFEDASTVRQIEVQLGTTDGKFTDIKQGISPTSEVIIEVEPIKKENVLLKGILGKPTGIGK